MLELVAKNPLITGVEHSPAPYAQGIFMFIERLASMLTYMACTSCALLSVRTVHGPGVKCHKPPYAISDATRLWKQ
ncbi:hypothetical protein [Paenibacillus vortex]|uniref:hypothetical protein n=1 Tax=Paenibacillus vortex TaxID=71995 RepID=UPI001F16A9D6|nr:hypothetical protein [Paenibacillus vortex]